MGKQLSSSKPLKPLNGEIKAASNKSISHRALMFGGIAVGKTKITGLLEGEDVFATADAMRKMGAVIERQDDGSYHVQGAGLGGLREPSSTVDMGNSGTSVRLLMGLIAGCPINVCFSGDASLSSRPMGRVLDPLCQMGAKFLARDGVRLPLAMRGTAQPVAIKYACPMPSAQVKSAILLAGLTAKGKTTVIEPTKTRDHTENMLRAFGVNVEVDGNSVSVLGGQELKACNIDVPVDPSSAAFPALGAMIVDGSEIVIPNVGVSPLRDGFFRIARAMGADIEYQNRRYNGGEEVADIVVRGTGALNGMEIPPDAVPSMVDEIPALAMLAACANGTTRMTGLGELRVKESDRLDAISRGLEDCGVKIKEGKDSLVIYGNGNPPKGGAIIESRLDHRIAMSFLTLGCASAEKIGVDDASPIDTSFPNFVKVMNDIGTNISS